MYNFWNFGHLPSFMPKYDNFENSMASISETAAHRAKISSISTPCGRKRIYVQLLELWPLAKFYAQLWQVRMASILKNAACRAKISSIFTPWGRNKLYVQLLALWPMATFQVEKEYMCNSWHFGC